MTKASFPSDSIVFKDISTGGNSAGNGGEGYYKGDITNNPSIDFQPSNKAYGADVNVNTGDHVDQKAYWNAGGANANAEWYAKAYGGDAQSNGDQSSWSGNDTSNVSADTNADQSNFLAADQHQSVAAGIGGSGGNNNEADGGNVSPNIDYANLNNVLNDAEHFHVDDFVHT
jgi:hypothetical protein